MYCGETISNQQASSYMKLCWWWLFQVFLHDIFNFMWICTKYGLFTNTGKGSECKYQ